MSVLPLVWIQPLCLQLTITKSAGAIQQRQCYYVPPRS